MHTFSSLDTIRLPVFHDDVQSEEIVHGYEVLSQRYDGWTNKVEIQPYRYVGPDAYGILRPMEPVGQSYTIGERHLTRLIVQQHDRPTA